MEWKPIETAPNYVSILVHSDDGEIELVEDDDNDYTWVPYNGVRERCCSKPTHWMPLPEPPQCK